MLTAVDLPYVAQIQDGPTVEASNARYKISRRLHHVRLPAGRRAGHRLELCAGEQALLEKPLEELLRRLPAPLQSLVAVWNAGFATNMASPAIICSPSCITRWACEGWWRIICYYSTVAESIFRGGGAFLQSCRCVRGLSCGAVQHRHPAGAESAPDPSQSRHIRRLGDAGEPGGGAACGNAGDVHSCPDHRHPGFLGLLFQHAHHLWLVLATLAEDL